MTLASLASQLPFYGTCWAAELSELHSSCKAVCKGVRSVPMVYRDSKRAKDHEAGPERLDSDQCGRQGAAARKVTHIIADALHDIQDLQISLVARKGLTLISGPISSPPPRYRVISGVPVATKECSISGMISYPI